jgi:hypothetical protein
LEWLLEREKKDSVTENPNSTQMDARGDRKFQLFSHTQAHASLLDLRQFFGRGWGGRSEVVQNMKNVFGGGGDGSTENSRDAHHA